MNPNLSRSELNLLLSQLQQRLSELKTQPDDIESYEPNDLPKRTNRLTLKNQAKAMSMHNLDSINTTPTKKRDSKSQIFPDAPKVASGKSMGNLAQVAQDNSLEWLPRNEVFRHSASVSHSSSSPLPSAPSSNHSMPSANPTNRSYRRFAHSLNPEFSFESFWSKKRQALEYREQLDRQVEEKQRQHQRMNMMERLQESLLDQKVNEQQKHMKEEFEAEHHFDKDNPENKAILDGSTVNDKNEALPQIASASGTIHSKPPHFDQKDGKNRQSIDHRHVKTSKSPQSSTTAMPSTDSSSQTRVVLKSNGATENHHDQATTSRHLPRNRQNVWTQTDDSLLFDLIHEFMASEAMHRNTKSTATRRANNVETKSGSTRRNKSTDRPTLARTSITKPTVYRRK